MPEYRATEFVVRYDPTVCTHAANCVRGLPAVFDIDRTPWIDLNGADAEAVRRQVARCPSGALTFESLREPGR
jgi:uncharacterized Fe-S cluster protein YjdI